LVQATDVMKEVGQVSTEDQISRSSVITGSSDVIIITPIPKEVERARSNSYRSKSSKGSHLLNSI